ncbi:uncharacterized protein LOC103932240 [Pyrus x bretschneideri]|uniref:uncharacterized protein LOC103932240 n=1 Tax=Pyrus x bretschneideri TaxID=225117 RepID=UPI002030CBC0|nr:uncharacterized protein LOC103932240 [Pyrus x bretschneideri]
MSGGVGPTCGDISLPKEQEHEFKEHNDETSSKLSSHQKSPTSHSTATASPRKAGGGLFSFRQLNALAVVVVLSASGMVSPQDFAFVFFSVIYMHIISKVAFPILGSSRDPTVFNPKNKVLRLYVLTGAVIGLLLPIAYILEGIFEGDKQASAPLPRTFFSLPVRRIFTIVDWLRSEFSKEHEEYGGSAKRLYVGRGLAIANMAFWCFNLFGFLLPVYLPRAFKKYYSAHKLKDY